MSEEESQAVDKIIGFENTLIDTEFDSCVCGHEEMWEIIQQSNLDNITDIWLLEFASRLKSKLIEMLNEHDDFEVEFSRELGVLVVNDTEIETYDELMTFIETALKESSDE